MRDQFQSYLKSEKGYRPVTVSQYLYYYDKFPHEDFSKNSIYNFLVNRFPNDIARSFLKAYIKFLNQKYGYEYNHLDLLPEPKRKSEKPVPKVLKEKEVLDLADNMNSKRDKIGVLLSFYAGLRINELINLKATDFDWYNWVQDPNQNGELNVRPEIAKGGKERTVLVASKVMDEVYSYIKTHCEPIMQNNLFFGKNGKVISLRRWQDVIQKKSQEVIGKKIHPHTLRHSFGTHCVEKGMGLEKIKKLLGHESISTTQIYLHISNERVKEDYERVFNA